MGVAKMRYMEGSLAERTGKGVRSRGSSHFAKKCYPNTTIDRLHVNFVWRF